eukprot:CAMPEP_0195510770 /NCGR_PEP_ID=MMETSP0794_2-20130614/3318_1 /TAXON_ID=515487 /ORGANISM="Stephanopyxis turris, Strain CCMP 815" /LENGTH=88 /DNA_ID=CAMNT_0040638257 /DNA_START=535 /DNA_END=798 /DNA_ORIENTATION=+
MAATDIPFGHFTTTASTERASVNVMSLPGDSMMRSMTVSKDSEAQFSSLIRKILSCKQMSALPDFDAAAVAPFGSIFFTITPDVGLNW